MKNIIQNKFTKAIIRQLHRFLVWMGSYIVIFFISFFLIVAFLPIGEYVIKGIKKYFRENTEYRIDIRNISVDFPLNLELQGICIHHQDSLIVNIGSIAADLDQLVFAYLSNKYTISGIHIDSFTVIDRKIKNESELTQLIHQLAPKKVSSKTKPKANSKSNYILKDFVIKNIRYDKIDSIGDNIGIQCQQINFDYTTLAHSILTCKNLSVQSANVLVHKGNAPGNDSSFVDLFKLPFQLSVSNLQVDNSELHVLKKKDTGSETSITQITTDIEDVQFHGEYYLNKPKLHATINGNMEVDDFIAEKIIFSRDSASVQHLKAKFLGSPLELDAGFLFQSTLPFKSLSDDIFLDIRSLHVYAQLDALQKVLPKTVILKRFITAGIPQLIFQGKLKGPFNALIGQGIELSNAQKNLLFKGTFTSHDLAFPEYRVINFQVEELLVDLPRTKSLLVDVGLPEYIFKLGKTSFKGKFDGFIQDFTLDGNATTQLGDFGLNINMKNNGSNLQYKGRLVTRDFQLGKFIDNDKIGEISTDIDIKNGTGVLLNDAKAIIDGNISSLKINNKFLRNILVKGSISKSEYDGMLSMVNELGALRFSGIADLTKEIPVVKSFLKVDSLKIQEFFPEVPIQKLTMSARIDLTGLKWSQLEGSATFDHVAVTYKNKDLSSRVIKVLLNNIASPKQIQLTSEFADFNYQGEKDILEAVPGFVYAILNRVHHENLLPSSYANKQLGDFELKANVKNAEVVNHLIGNQVLVQKAECYIKKKAETDSIFYTSDSLVVGKLYVTSPNIEIHNILSNTKGEITAYQVMYDNVLLGLDHCLKFTALDSNYIFSLKNAIIENIHYELNAGLEFKKNETNLRIFDSFLNGDSIKPNPTNQITLSGKNFELNNCDLTYKNTLFSLRGDQSLLLCNVNNFDLNSVNYYYNYPKIAVSGIGNFELTVSDILEAKRAFKFISASKDLHINSMKIGDVDIRVEFKEKKFDDCFVLVQGDDHYLKASLLPGYSVDKKKFDFSIDAKQVPIRFLEFILIDKISELKGGGDLKGILKIDNKNITWNVDATLHDVGFVLGITKVRYHGDHLNFNINEKTFLFKDLKFYDDLQHEFTLNGKLLHDRFGDFAFDLNITTPNGEVLNTDASFDNPFYGKIYSQANMHIHGPDDEAILDMNLVPAANSVLYIPMENLNRSNQLGFIEFESEAKPKSVSKFKSLAQYKEGSSKTTVNVLMDLRNSPEVQIIFDRNSGDILKSYGTGIIQVNYGQNGLNMFGDYLINSGEYLFTLYNIVNKPFNLISGGKIHMDGDIYSTQLDISANYRPLFVPVLPVIGTEQADAGGYRDEANLPTEVNLKMFLKGLLLKPDISFSMSFPQVKGIMKTGLETVLYEYSTNENALNRQVFGLLVLGTFLPEQTFLPNSQYVAGINTMTEFLSNQLSLYINTLISNFLPSNSILNSVDVDLSYINNNVLNTTTGVSSTGDFKFSLNNALFNNKLLIDVGGTYTSNASSNGSYIAGDFLVQWVLTENRSLKLKFYRTNLPNIDDSRKARTGVGISLTRDFD